MDEILATFVESAKKNHEDILDIQSEISDLTDELKGFEDTYSKDYKKIVSQIDDLNAQLDRLVTEAVSKIELPQPERIDYLRLETSIKAKVNRIENSNKRDMQELKDDMMTFYRNNKPKDGKNASIDDIRTIVNGWLTNNRPKDGENGKDGKSGADGDDGVGIKSIKRENNDIVITLTNGKVHRFSLPTQRQILGGGGINLSALNEITELVETDYIVVMRNNKPVKISAINAYSFFGGGGVPSNALTYNGEALTYNDEYITY